MSLDFATVLVLLTILSGMIWLVDSLVFARKRAGEGVSDTEAVHKPPVIVDYARSFFPIFLFVLVLRSFVAEPFRIPSASMMPTLLIGDFILVNKYEYGIRLPVLNNKIIENKTPQRGEIVVFRYPRNPDIPYIKRVIGLPGDQIIYRDKVLYINGERMPQTPLGYYDAVGAGKIMDGVLLLEEDLGVMDHPILVDPETYSLDIETRVPPGQYFVLGDNRDNSKDSRFWGFVPDENLMGRAFMIWMNWDVRNGGIDWKRIGTILQ